MLSWETIERRIDNTHWECSGVYLSWSAQGRDLNKYWHIINGTVFLIWIKIRYFSLTGLDNAVCEMTAILFRLLFVKLWISRTPPPNTHTHTTPLPTHPTPISDKTSYRKISWSTDAYVPFKFESDRTILNTNLTASRDLTMICVIRYWNMALVSLTECATFRYWESLGVYAGQGKYSTIA